MREIRNLKLKIEERKEEFEVQSTQNQ